MAITADVSNIERMVRDFAGDKAAQLGDAFVSALRSNMPRRTGELAESAEVDQLVVSDNGASAHITIGAPYAGFVNDGTGIYGPEGTPIVPVNGRVLVFDSPAAGGLVFATSVRGSEPTHFWERTIERWPDIVASA